MSTETMKLAHQVQRDQFQVSPYMVDTAGTRGGGRKAAAQSAAAADAAGAQLLTHLSNDFPREDAISDIFALFDPGRSGVLDFPRFCAFFRLVSPEVLLTEPEFGELLVELGCQSKSGIPRGPKFFGQFFDGLDDANVRSMHSRARRENPDQAPTTSDKGCFAAPPMSARDARPHDDDTQAQARLKRRLLARQAQRFQGCYGFLEADDPAPGHPRGGRR